MNGGTASAFWLLCCGFLFGCTSLTWTDESGCVHHVGLVLGRTDELAHGRRAVVYKVGADLRVGGADSGYTVGLKRLSIVAPEVIEVTDHDELAQRVLAHVRESFRRPTSRGEWHPFYFSERVSSAATIACVSALGLDFRTGPASPGLSLGWHRGWQLSTHAFSNDVVHVHRTARGSAAVVSAALWILEPDTGTK